MKVNFIDLDSFEKIDKHNRTSNLNAYYSSTSILTLDHLETINLKLELIKSGYDLSSVHCIVVYTTISKDTLQLIPSDIKGVLIYHVDKSGQLVASVFQYSNSKYSMIEDLKGYTDFTTFNQFENVSNKLPYKDNEYKSAIIIGREKSYRTKRKNRYEFDSKLRSQLIGNTDLDPVKS